MASQVRVPTTTTTTNHGLYILCESQLIGGISKWTLLHDRPATLVYEFGFATPSPGGAASSGEAYEAVPGNVTGTSISIARYDIYTKKFEQAFGRSFDIDMLSQQKSNLTFQQKIANPDGVGNDEVIIISGVWFTKIGRSHSTSDSRIVFVDASATYVKMRKGSL